MRLQVHNHRPREGEHLWKTVDQYYSTYWGGLDAKVYAGEVLLDEVVTLQWQLEEAVMPLFGYHAYTFQRAAHGARRASGAFTINFKRDSYLFELLRSQNQPAATGSAFNRAQAAAPDPAVFRGARDGTATLDDFMAYVTSGEAAAGKGPLRLDPSRLADVSHAFEAAIWGKGQAPAQDRSVQGLLKFAQQDAPRFELAQPLDLHVQFGERRVRIAEKDPRNPSAGRLQDTRQYDPRAGDVRPEDAPVPVSTYTRVVGVEITGVSRILDDSGRPVLEGYTFLASDVL